MELLIVIVVIGILAAITIVAYNGVQDRAHAATAQSDASNLVGLLGVANATNGSYPADLSTINNGGPMPSTDGTTYAYHPGTGNTSYCATVTNGNSSFKVTDTVTAPVNGGCPGDGVGGVAAVTNLVTNPSFEAGSTGWQWGPSATVGTSSTAANSGTSSITFTHTSGTTGNAYLAYKSTGLVIGQQYVVAYYAKSLAGSPSIAPSIQDSGIGGARPAGFSAQWIAPSASWSRYTVTWTADASTSYLVLDYTGTGSGESTALDSVMLTQGSAVYGYADGNSANWLWNGTPNNSTSTGPAL